MDMECDYMKELDIMSFETFEKIYNVDRKLIEIVLQLKRVSESMRELSPRFKSDLDDFRLNVAVFATQIETELHRSHIKED